jgi:hypothetical protein
MTVKHSWTFLVTEALTAAEQAHPGEDTSLSEVYARVEALRQALHLPFSATWRCTVRRTLQQSPTAERGHQPGFWRLRPTQPPRVD